MYMKLKFEARYPCVCRKVGEKKEWRDGFKLKVVVLGGAHHKVERIPSPPTPGSCGQTTTFC